MKKILITVSLLVFFGFSATAQSDSEITEKSKKGLYGGIYTNLGGSYIPSFNLSDNLTTDGLADLNGRFLLTVGIGTRFELNRFGFALEMNSIRFNTEENNVDHRLRGLQGLAHLSYLVLGNRDLGLEVGFTVNYTEASLLLLSQNTSIDFNSISPTTQTGALELQYNPVGIGGNIGILTGSDKSNYLTGEIVLSYQRVINQSGWFSEYATTQNAPSERGQNIFSVTARFYLLRGKYSLR